MTCRRFLIHLVLLAGFVFTGGANARAQAAGESPATQPAAASVAESQRLVDRPDERVSVLDNGLKVILKAHRTAPVVSVRMYCRTGSIYEQEYLGSGISHLFEHLLHSGATTTRSEEESARLLNQLGGNTNAYTSFDVTCYYINTSKDQAAAAIDLLGDWLTRPTFPEGAFQREWGVVQRELERDIDEPDQQLFVMTLETMFRGHPAQFPIIGHQPIVQKITRQDILNYHQRMYVPDRMVVCIVGDINLDETLRSVQKSFASVERRPVPIVILPEAPDITTPQFAAKRMQTQAAILRLAYPSIRLTHPDLYALDVLSYIMTQGDSSRLARAIRDTGLAFNVDSSSWTPEWARGIFSITARLAPEKLEATQAAILKEIERLQAELVTPEELRQAQQQKAAEHVFAMQTAESVAEVMAHDFLATGDVHFSDAYVENIQKVTPEQVRDMARKYLVRERLSTIAVLPENQPVQLQEGPGTGEPEPIRRLVLDNGARVLIRRDPTTPLVSMQTYSLGGVLLEDEQTNGLSRLAAQLAPRGTRTRNAEEIARFFDARGGSISGSSGSNTIYFQAQVLTKDFAESLEVFADVVCHPAFPEDQLKLIAPQQVDQIQQVNEAWRSELFDYFKSRFFENSPYRLPTLGSPRVVSQATRQQVESFYRRCVTGPQTVIAIFGDVDAARAEELVRRHFSELPGTRVETPVAPAPTPPQKPKLFIKQKPPTRAAAGVAVGFPGITFGNTADSVGLALLDTIISGYRYPTGWLFESLRGGNRSLVYEVHAQNVPGLVPGYLWAYAACQPDKVNEVYGIMKEQFAKAREGDISPDELDRAKAIIRTSELMDAQTNSDRAMQASLDELYGLGYDYRQRFLDAVEAATLEDVKRVARKYITTTPVVAVVTPAPDQVQIGVEPVRIEVEEPPAGASAEPPAGGSSQ